MSILQYATDVRGNLQQFAVGQWAPNADIRRTGTLFNQSPQLVQISTITVSGPTNSHAYTITITTPAGAFDIVYTSDGTATTQEVVDGFVALINADGRVRGDLKAVSTSSTVITLTGLYPGRAFTVTEAEADLAVATTQAAAAAAAIPVGRGVISQGYDTAGEAEELGALAASALMTAQVATVTPTFVSGAVLTATVRLVRGIETEQIASVSETSATNLATTLAALLAGLNTQLPANTVNVTGGVTNLVFTAEIAGLEFVVEMSSDDSGASVPTGLTPVPTTGPNPSTSIHQALRGVSMRPLDEECATIGGADPTWPANRGVVVGKQGPLGVESAEVVTAGAPAFIELGVTADNGKFFMVTSATRVQLSKSLARWERDGRDVADNLAVLRLNFA